MGDVAKMPIRGGVLKPRDVAAMYGLTYDEGVRICKVYGVRPGKRNYYIHPATAAIAVTRPWELEAAKEARVRERDQQTYRRDRRA